MNESMKGKLDLARTKAGAAMSEIKDNFKASDGATGVRKVQSMFVNLWKSGTAGKVALVAVGVVVAVLIKTIVLGGDGGATKINTLVVKGLYMRMPGDDAVKACQQMVSSLASSTGLEVVDFRNGIAWTPEEKAAVDAEYEEKKRDCGLQLLWFEHLGKMSKASNHYGQDKLKEMGLVNYTWEEWKAKHAKDYDPSKVDQKELKERLEALNVLPPDDKFRILPKNLIVVAVKAKGVSEDKWAGLCFVTVDENDSVNQVFFNAHGIGKFFNAADLTGSDFAKLLVKNYADIPDLVWGMPGGMDTSEWTYRDPRGYYVRLYERVYLGSSKKKREWSFCIKAVEPESARKFD